MTAPSRSLQESLAGAVIAFRLGREGEANEAMTILIDTLGAILPHVSPENLAPLSTLLPEILDSQDRQDFLKIADLLEYRLAPLMDLTIGTAPNSHISQPG